MMSQRTGLKSPVHIHLEDAATPVHVHVEKPKKYAKPSSIDVGLLDKVTKHIVDIC